MKPELLQLLGAALGGGAFAKLLTWRPERDGKIVDNAVTLVNELQEEVARMRAERTVDRAEIDELRTGRAADRATLEELRLEISRLRAIPPRCATCPLWADRHPA